MNLSYEEFLAAKVPAAGGHGEDISAELFNPLLKSHQRVAAQWMVQGMRRACFMSFGLGKTIIQLEACRVARDLLGGDALALITMPLGVVQEFERDAAMLGVPFRFIRSFDQVDDPRTIYGTNYEPVRDGRLDPRRFSVTSLDEAAILASFGGTKTFREFMRLFADDDGGTGQVGGGIPYRFVATATPDPNEYIELLAYAAYLGIADVGVMKTRFFKRNSEHADALTLRPHKEREFWLWVASWALFCEKPSDLGAAFSDEGYELPPLEVHWHMIPSDHASAQPRQDGQARMFRESTISVQNQAREKRDSLSARVAKLMELRALEPEGHRVLWHDLESERHALEAAIPSLQAVYGAQNLEDRLPVIRAFSDGELAELAAKPVMLGAGCNFQRYCSWAIFLGIGFKFRDFIQAVHRLYRFLQDRPVRLDLIYTEAEAGVRQVLETKWRKHDEMVAHMTSLIREYGLGRAALDAAATRTLGCERVEVVGDRYRMVNADAIEESRRMNSESVDLIVTSPPFSTQYEYSPSYNDLGHTDDDEHFFQHLGYLTPELFRVLKPGRIAALHVKDRIVPGGVSGFGFQTVSPFSDMTVAHMRAHGFAFMARKTVVTDVVRENNQTYRLGWTEQCKDGTKMGYGMPEYILVFRKPPTDRSNGYADEPVIKSKQRYTRSRWQIDAHGFARSSGDRLLTSEELLSLPHERLFKWFREYSLNHVYDYEEHVTASERLESEMRLPTTFMLFQPPSWHPDVWTDVARMRTLNMLQERKGQEQHLCLARDSQVLTKEHGYIAIQEVQSGDHVLTHRGRWQPVLAVQNTGVRPVVTVRAQGVPGLTLTPDHKLWTRKSDWVRERDGAERAEPDWLPASEVLGGYVNLQLPPAEEEAPGDKLHWWLVGRWLADGHWDGRGAAIISCGEHELVDLLRTIVGRAGGTYWTRTACQIRLLDTDGSLKAVLHRCGHGAAGKHLPPEAFTLPTAQAAALLDGYLSGDGHHLAEQLRWMTSSVSRELLLGVAMLVQRVHGTVASVYAGRSAREATIEGRRVQCAQEWVLCFDLPADRRKSVFVLDDGAWKRVRSIDDAGEVETWNLRVAEDESYTAEGCIVKNCPIQFDIVDRLIEQFSQAGEVVFDPFAGLGTVPYCALRKGRQGLGIELSPSYFRDAIGYCEAAARQTTMPGLFDALELEPEMEETA